MSRNYGLRIFICVFISALIAQGTTWWHLNYLDWPAWSEGAAIVAAGSLPAPSHLIYGYPGTLLLLPSALLILAGIEELLATKIIMVVHLSFGIACTTFLCYQLRRRSLWWLYAGVILCINPFFVRSTPPTAHITILACITALFTLYLFEKKSEVSPSSFAALGALGGLLLMSRFDIGVVLFASSVLFLWRFRNREVLLSVFFAIFIAYIGDPFLWSNPLHYFISIYEKIITHAAINKFSVASTVFDYFNLSVFLGTLSFLVGIAFVFQRSVSAPIPLPYLKGLISVTALVVGALVLSHHHPVWLFFPFSFVWELFLPLFIFTLVDYTLLQRNQAKVLLASIIFAHVAVLSIVIATH